jgi:NADPH2:quinone reductase
VKGWVVEGVGEPRDVLRWRDDLATPRPGGGQVLVRVLASACNFPDILLCQGTYQDRPEPPFVLGLEVAGEVVEAGPGARSAVGDLVIGTPPVGAGGYAEYAVLDQHSLVPWPEGMSAAQAASYFVSFQTALCALDHRGRLREGETLLVHAAAGGVGSAAVQIGVAMGAHVIATAGGRAKADLAARLGASDVLDYHSTDIVSAVKDLTGGAGADVVVDSVGGSITDASRRVTAFEGRLVVVGFAGGDIARMPSSHVLVKNYSVVGVHWGLYRARNPELIARWQARLDAWWADGRIAPVVGLELPVREAVSALERLAARDTVGKVVLAWS